MASLSAMDTPHPHAAEAALKISVSPGEDTSPAATIAGLTDLGIACYESPCGMGRLKRWLYSLLLFVSYATAACPAGYFCPTGSVASAQLCPPGHVCPSNTTMWNRPPASNCGRGNYCPEGSACPAPCPLAIRPNGPPNGPAFDIDTASCYEHCFNGGPGQLSRCTATSIPNLCQSQPQFYFFTWISSDTIGLWKLNGLAGNASLAATINAPGFSKASWLSGSGHVLYFAISYQFAASELWRTDGSPQGTRLVTDKNLTLYSLQSGAIGSSLLFLAPSTNADGMPMGRSLWITDGTYEGTRVLYGGNLVSMVPLDFASLGNKVIYGAYGGAVGNEVLVSDGTVNGTYFIDIYKGWRSSFSVYHVTMGGAVYFLATDGLYSTKFASQLWKTDGTATGTVCIHNISGLPLSGESVTPLWVWNTTLFFFEGGVLWESNGTSEGTRQLVGAQPPIINYYQSEGAVLAGFWFFPFDDLTSGVELWKTDGTVSFLVKDINTGAISSNPANFTKIGSLLFFTADDGVHGPELWRTDGTAAGTLMVQDTFEGPVGSFPSRIQVQDA